MKFMSHKIVASILVKHGAAMAVLEEGVVVAFDSVRLQLYFALWFWLFDVFCLGQLFLKIHKIKPSKKCRQIVNETN